MSGIDPTRVKAGDVVRRVWDDVMPEDVKDDVTPGDGIKKSCHCSYLVEVTTRAGKGEREPKRVIAHDLRAGDVIDAVESRGDEPGCHCDVYFHVRRLVTGAPLPVGTRVSHVNQQWHRDHMGGTATVYGSEGPYSDGSYEYDVMAGEDISRRTGADNKEIRPARWSSLAVRKAGSE